MEKGYISSTQFLTEGGDPFKKGFLLVSIKFFPAQKYFDCIALYLSLSIVVTTRGCLDMPIMQDRTARYHQETLPVVHS